jgi:hypothetical protein
MKNKFDLWTEGYSATGQRGSATFHGEFEGENLKEAVAEFQKTLTPYEQRLINLDHLTFWGCRFFSNESDARRSFG